MEKIEEILSLTSQQRTKMGMMGRMRMEELFDRNIVVNEYIKAIISD